MKKWINDGCPGGDGVEIIWQCGKFYKKGVDEFMAEAQAARKGGAVLPFIHHTDFIGRMDLAYAIADVVISRSGASTVSELCAAHRAAIFVPSPNVADDHQTHNAMALVRKKAAMIIKDVEAEEKLLGAAIYLLKDPQKIKSLQEHIALLALPDAAQTIADEAYRVVDSKKK